MDNTCTDCNQLVRHCTCSGTAPEPRTGWGPECSSLRCPRATFLSEVIRSKDALLAPCAPYLKEGETPAQRIERELHDTDAVLRLLVREKLRHEALRRAAEALTNYAWSAVQAGGAEATDYLNELLQKLRVELKMPVESLTFKEALDFTLAMLTDTARQHDDLRQAVGDAAPIIAEFAKANRKHHVGETWQDPAGAHAWLDRNGA